MNQGFNNFYNHQANMYVWRETVASNELQELTACYGSVCDNPDAIVRI